MNLLINSLQCCLSNYLFMFARLRWLHQVEATILIWNASSTITISYASNWKSAMIKGLDSGLGDPRLYSQRWQSIPLSLQCSIHPSQVLTELCLKYQGSTVRFYTPHAHKRSPTAYSRRVVNSGGHWYRVQLQYYCFRCTLQRITLSTSKYKTIPAVLHYVLIGAR